MATNNNLSNVPGAVPYISMVSDQANALMINAFNERTKQYEAQLNAIAENEALLNQMKYRDPDRAGALVKAAKISSDLDKEIQDKYAGDYAATGARKAVASRIAQERGVFSTLQQKYEEEQPYKQLYNQYDISGQLSNKFNPTTNKSEKVNPFNQSFIDSEGNLTNASVNYGDIKKRGDYIGYVTENIVNPLNKRMTDLGIQYKQGPTAFTKTSIQRTKVGMSPEEAANTIDDNTAKRFLEDNPNYAFESGNSIEGAKNFIKGIVRDKISEQIHPNYGVVTDQWGMMNATAALKAKKAEAPRDMFVSPSKEAAQSNPFITERQKSGKTLQGMWSNLSNKSRESNVSAIRSILLKRLSEVRKGGIPGVPISQYKSIEEGIKLKLNDLGNYGKEVAERKTNWFDQAAQSITGNPEARFKKLSGEERKRILQKAPKNENEWAKTFDADLDGKTLTYRNQESLLPELQKYLGTVIETSGSNFRTSEGGTTSQNINDVAKEVGINPQVLRQAIKTVAFPMTRIPATGEYAIRIPKDLRLTNTGKIDYSKMDDKNSITIYQSIDTPTREMSDVLKWAEQNRFTTGTPSNTFEVGNAVYNIKKERGNNVFSVNGVLLTKEQLERNMRILTNEHLNDKYYSKIPKEKFMGEGSGVEGYPSQ